MKVVGIYIQDSTTLEYNRVDLFDDEKISVTSSIQNINDIAKTYTDFSQTFTVPASKQNNKIFRHWYDNSNDFAFSTLVKANAYIEIDTISFRIGKIQLESANVIDGKPQDYSITFIGILGNLKDTFAGKFLKDLTSTAYDFNYSAEIVGALVIQNAVSDNIMFPLISSNRRWNFQSTTDPTNNINDENYPIRYNELFPAIRLRAVLNMIETEFGINFDGTTEEPSIFLSDARFTNAYLYLKNRDEFKTNLSSQIDFTTLGTITSALNVYVDLAENYFQKFGGGATRITITPQAGFTTVPYTVKRYLNDQVWDVWNYTGTLITNVRTDADTKKHSFYIEANQAFQFVFKLEFYDYSTSSWKSATMDAQTLSSNISISSYFPEIKIEDFFSGLLKMFNLTCYSTDGINYTVEQLESYYGAGSDIDITKYVLQDKKALNRVKTYKRINFEYEKSESLVNVGFNSNAGIEYGSLRYVNDPITEGDEYSVKLPFEDLNFTNLFNSFQVGFCLKTDNQAYIPKPIILYDYNSTNTTTAGFTFYWSNSLTGDGAAYTTYKAFGQETLANGDLWSLNFNEQQSTLTNEIVNNSLYQSYYSNYFANIYNLKARLIKLSAILPTSILTTLKLNDSIIIRDSKYLINSYTTDLTTGLVQFELLTDERVKTDKSLVLNLDAGNPESYPTSGTLWTDLSGYGNNGTLVNGPTFDSANGGGIVFDGVNDYVDNINQTISIQENTPFSIQVIFKGTSTSQLIGNWNTLVNGGWRLVLESGKIRFYLVNSIGNGRAVSSVLTSYNNGNIYNVIITYDGSSNANNINLYVNSSLISKTVDSNISPGTLTNSKITLAASQINTSSFTNFLNGNIYETLIYNRALSDTEILQNFNETKERYGL